MNDSEHERLKAVAKRWVTDLKTLQTEQTDIEKERRAFELLQWVTFGLPADFDPILAQEAEYTRLQKERSDKALDEFDQEHATKPLSELDAFRELEKQGIYTQNDFYSPSKAQDGFYSAALKRFRSQKRVPSNKGAKNPINKSRSINNRRIAA